MNVQDISIEFLDCLSKYRKNLLLSKSYYGWKLLHKNYKKRVHKLCIALDFWSIRIMKKYFTYLKQIKKSKNLILNNAIAFRCLIYWMATSLLTKDRWYRFKNKFDKLILCLYEVNA